MSELLKRNKHFLKLLISTTQTQVKALMVTATRDQLLSLVEIAYNLIDRSEFNSLHYRLKKLITFLADLSISLKRKTPVLVKHRLLLIKALKQFRDIFEE